MGKDYIVYLRDIFTDLLNVYKLYSQQISTLVVQGQSSHSSFKPMKALRRDILRLIQIYIESEQDFSFFN